MSIYKICKTRAAIQQAYTEERCGKSRPSNQIDAVLLMRRQGQVQVRARYVGRKVSLVEVCMYDDV